MQTNKEIIFNAVKLLDLLRKQQVEGLLDTKTATKEAALKSANQSILQAIESVKLLTKN